MTDPFLTLYSRLDRQGPGEPADIHWVAEQINLSSDAKICDAACGVGADIPTLLEIAPEGHITAVDAAKPMIDALHARLGPDQRITAYVGKMEKIKGPFDLIWCAGAVYFLGIEKALSAWRPALNENGVIVFSEPCYFTENPSAAARAFWQDEDAFITDAAGIDQQIQAAGFKTVAKKPVALTAWQAYYDSLQTHCQMLQENADLAMSDVIEAAQNEITAFGKAAQETGYLLSIVRPA